MDRRRVRNPPRALRLPEIRELRKGISMADTDFAALSRRQNILPWAELKEIDWDNVPVTGSAEHVYYSRDVAGFVRNYDEFYTAAERSYAMALERWLTRYSLEHTHADLRS